MASFSDAISQFNPYVQQLPVDLMAKVGMQKQAQYDAGVQKVQQHIDNVAGMDVANPADKAYLQSKLGELGDNLKTVAGGDFSNQQLVNSVGGMATAIVKDPVIQEAVSSTSYYKKGVAAMDEARKKGTIGASNAYVFNKQAKEWLENPQAGSQFRGTYTPYVDVNKKVIDTISKIHSNANLKDIGYVIKNDGTIDTTKILDALHKQGYEGVNEAQIRTVLNSTLDATDINQLHMDGAYNLKSYDRDALTRVATGDYEKSIKMYSAKLEQANKDLLIANTPAKVEQLNEVIDFYKTQLGDKDRKGALAEGYDNTLKLITENPDSARGKLYAKNYIDGIANGFAWAHIKDELETNPIKENFWKAKNYDLDIIRENNQERHRQVNDLIAQGHLSNETLKIQHEIAKDQIGGQPYFTGSGDAVTDNLESYKNFNSYVGNLETENSGILTNLAKENSNNKTKLTARDIQVSIENGTFKPKTEAQQRQYDLYIRNRNTVANQRELLDQYENEASKEISGGLNQKQALDKALSGAGPLTIGGVTFSPKEVYNYLQKERYISTPGPGGTVQSLGINTEGMTDREKLLFSKMGARYRGGALGGGATGNAVLDNYLGRIKNSINQFSDFTNKVNILVAKKLAPTTGIFRSEQSAVTFKDESAKDKFIANITNLAKANLDQKAAGPNHDPENMISLLTNKGAKDVDFQVRRQGSDYWIQVTDKNDPNKVERMKVDANFVASNPSLGQAFMNADVDMSQLTLANAGSTNIFKDYKHAYYQNLGGYDANQNKTVTLPVRADLISSGGDLNAVFRVKTTKGEVPITFPKPISSRADFERYLSGLTDDTLIKMLKTQQPNIEQLIKR